MGQKSIILCPATMCPLFAPNGSDWVQEKNSVCPQKAGLNPDNECPWWNMGCQDGQSSIVKEIAAEIKAVNEPSSYDCPYAARCSWQQNSKTSLCPPRTFLELGIDPKHAKF
jgi:hypothetical protein